MKVGIISDTHDNVAAVERAVTAFETENVDTVIHCGDVIAPPVVPYFEGLEVHAVLGNNDGEIAGLEAAFRDLGQGSELHGTFAHLAFGDREFAVLHGEDGEEIDNLAAADTYDYVCYGHHHEAEQRDVEGTTVINPGGHFPTVPAEHQRVAVVDTESDDVLFVNVAE